MTDPNRRRLKLMKRNAKRKARRAGLVKFKQQDGQKVFSLWS